jgi:hypothetical protein
METEESNQRYWQLGEEHVRIFTGREVKDVIGDCVAADVGMCYKFSTFQGLNAGGLIGPEYFGIRVQFCLGVDPDQAEDLVDILLEGTGSLGVTDAQKALLKQLSESRMDVIHSIIVQEIKK